MDSEFFNTLFKKARESRENYIPDPNASKEKETISRIRNTEDMTDEQSEMLSKLKKDYQDFKDRNNSDRE